MRFNSTAVMVEALLHGLGTTILPCFVGDRQPRLRRIGPYREGGTQLWVLTHPELRAAAPVRAFAVYLRELVARDRGLFLGRDAR